MNVPVNIPEKIATNTKEELMTHVYNMILRLIYKGEFSKTELVLKTGRKLQIIVQFDPESIAKLNLKDLQAPEHVN